MKACYNHTSIKQNIGQMSLEGNSVLTEGKINPSPVDSLSCNVVPMQCDGVETWQQCQLVDL